MQQTSSKKPAGEPPFVEATQLIALLNLVLRLTVVHRGLRRTPCCHSERQPAGCDYQAWRRLSRAPTRKSLGRRYTYCTLQASSWTVKQRISNIHNSNSNDGLSRSAWAIIRLSKARTQYVTGHVIKSSSLSARFSAWGEAWVRGYS